MIAGLRGNIAAKSVDAIMVDCGGVIYRAGTSATTLGETGPIGDDILLHTHLVVREDALALFGFSTSDELRVFETLIAVTGVGPRLACAVLSRFPVEQLHQVISTENTRLLATVPGIGPKTAARVLLELRGKLPALANNPGAPLSTIGTLDDEVIEALRSLGYTVTEAHTALAGIQTAADAPVEERLLAALRILGE